MNIGSIIENLDLEKRVSITPDVVKKYVSLNLNVCIEKNYGNHLGITDEEYKSSGANILPTKEEVINKSDIVVQVNFPENNSLNFFKKDNCLIGTFGPHSAKGNINKMVKMGVNIFSLDLLPRITRAQSMDVLSSQNNLAGYRSVVESIYEFKKAIPMMMTAAGTIPAAKIFVIGVGVAGLQAIATAKRLGAIVSATDVRSVAKEQVESLGGKFLMVETKENLETKGGYAKEVSEDYKIRQKELLKSNVIKNDIIICTALIPGKTAPRLITEDMIKNMKSGSVIYDLAVEQGGNSAYSEPDKKIEKNGVKIIGHKNILNQLPITASNLYAKNIFNFVANLLNKEKNAVNLNKEDEIISKTLIDKET